MGVVSIGSPLAAWHIAAARDQALEALQTAEMARSENHRFLVSGYIANGTRALDGGDLFGSLVWYGEALRLDGGEATGEDPHRVRLATVLRRCPRLVQVWFRDHGVAQAFSPTGRRVLLIQNEVARTWDVADGSAVSAPMKHNADVLRGAFSPDGSRVVTIAADCTARVWDPNTGKPITRPLPHDRLVNWAVFSPDGSRLATVGNDRTARLWDAATGQLLAGPLVHDQPVFFASFSRDGKRLVTCGGSRDFVHRKGEIRVWDLSAVKPSARVLSRNFVLRWAHLTADGEHVVAVNGGRTAFLWPLTPGRSNPSSVSIVRLDPEGAVGPDPSRVLKLDGSTAQVYDLAQGKPVGPPLLHGGEMRLAAFSPDGRLVVTAALDRTARVWDAVSGKPLTPPLRHGWLVRKATFSADGRRLLTTTEDGVVRVWDLASREQVQPLSAQGDTPSALSPDGRWIAAADKNGWVWVRDAVSNKVLRGPWKLTRPVSEVIFSPDGRRVLAATESGARVWDAVTGEPVTPLLSHAGGVLRLLFTPDGSRVAILGSNDLLEVYDAVTGTLQSRHALPSPFGLVLTPDGRGVVAALKPAVQILMVVDVISGAQQAGPFKHAAQATSAAVSPDGKRLAVATADGSAFLWDIASARPAAPPLQHGQPLHQVAFSGDGRRLVTLAEDHTARVWDVLTGQPVTPLLSQTEPVIFACLGPDGQRLVTRTRSGAGCVWDLSPDTRPIDDLVRLTHLLSGQVLDGRSGGFESVEEGSLRDAWPRLRARYHQEFTPSAP